MGLRSALRAVLPLERFRLVATAVEERYRCGTCGRTYDRRPRVCHACGSVTAPDS